MMKFFACCIGVATLALGATASWSQTRMLRIVVPYAAGGAPDVLARLLGDQIARAQGVTTVIENRPGAGAIIGTEAVMRATPDGNTVLIIANAFLINPHLRKVNYDAMIKLRPDLPPRERAVVDRGQCGRALSHAGRPHQRRPRRARQSHACEPGTGTTFHIGLGDAQARAGVNITYVPYAGSQLALNALVGGHVASVFSDYASLSGG